MTTFLADLRYAVRQLRKSPGFAVLAVATLAIGIGASTAIYSIVEGVLLSSLPYNNPQRLVSVFESFPALGFDQVTFSVPDYKYVADHNRSFSGIAAYRDQNDELSGSGEPMRVHTEKVTSSLFSVLGVPPLLGRTFTQREDESGAPVALLSDAFWHSHFGANPSAVGQKVLIDRKPYTIIGVMPRSFAFPSHGEKFNNTPGAIYLPMHFTPKQMQDYGNEFNYSAIARLKPGVSLAHASAEVNGLILQSAKLYPPIMRSNPRFKLGGNVASYNFEAIGDARTPLLLLQLAVLVVLLIACVDVANLLLARTTSRQREMALRIAVGAPRSRIVSQLLSESLVLAIAGGIVGLPLAYFGMHLLTTAAPIDLPRASSISLNGWVLAFCFGICIVTAILTGLIPALRALRIDPNQDLYEGGRSGTGGRGRHRILGTLVTAQFALAMVLVVTAGLLLRSFQRLVNTSAGFRADHVITMNTTLPLAAYSTPSQIKSFYRNLLGKVTPLPGVDYAGLAAVLPVREGEHDIFSVAAIPSHAERTANVAQTWVAGNYFRAMGIRLIRGRYFTPQDREGSQPVAIIGQSFADKYFAGMNPIGQRIKQGISPKDPWMTVVGVVADVKSRGMAASAESETYTPYMQMVDPGFFTTPTLDEARSLYLVTRTKQDPASMRNLLVSTFHSIDPSLPITDIHTMTALIRQDVAPQRFNSFILGIFAGIALLLAAAGIGGVLAYTVHQRTREIGVRMALGAERSDVSRLILRDGLRLALTGTAIGIVISLLTARLLASQLYQVSPHDPGTFVAGIVILFIIALVACWLPARRAASVDPMQALRSE